MTPTVTVMLLVLTWPLERQWILSWRACSIPSVS